jgi:hypothetical protein
VLRVRSAVWSLEFVRARLAGGSGNFAAGIHIATYQLPDDPLSRYNRRRFQLATPSRVASGGVFHSGGSRP